MVEKLTAKNEQRFFLAEDEFGGIGEMFTAAKRYAYTEIQEIAGMQGKAIRKVNTADMLKLKEDNFRLYKHVIENHWEVDPSRLFIMITREEYKEMVMAYQVKRRKDGEDDAVESARNWIDNLIRTIDHFKRDIERHKERFEEAVAGESQYMGPADYIDSILGDMQNLVGNIPFRNVTRIIIRLVEAGIHDLRKKKDE